MKKRKIEQINFEMSGKCNLRCPMCPQSTGREKGFLEKFPLDLFKKAVNDAIPYGLKYINLSGSGEPLVSKDLEAAIAYASKLNVDTMIYTNGVLLDEKRFLSLADAGLTICKVSCMGWDRDSYKYWMSVDKFDEVRDNLLRCKEAATRIGAATYLQTNHLIHDVSNLEIEKQAYIENWMEYLGIAGEIWIEHNWAGLYDNTKREEVFKGRKKRSCGRPLSNVVEVRAGGNDGLKGAVVPCPNVLGQDSKAVMGHLSCDSIVDIFFGENMEKLRLAHRSNKYEEFPYCDDCDQLLDIEEALVWTNVPGRAYGESRISNIKLVS